MNHIKSKFSTFFLALLLLSGCGKKDVNVSTNIISEQIDTKENNDEAETTEELPSLKDYDLVSYPEDLHHLDKIAAEICFGVNRWGNGNERVAALERAGYNQPGCDPEAIQERINQILEGAEYDVNNPDNIYHKYVDYYDKVDVDEDLRVVSRYVEDGDGSLKYVNQDTVVYFLDNDGNITSKAYMDTYQLVSSIGKFVLNDNLEYDYINWSDNEKAIIPSKNLTDLSELEDVTGYCIVEDKSDHILTVYNKNDQVVLEAQVWHGEEKTPTGIFSIHTKEEITDMYGKDYIAQNVKYVLFYSTNSDGTPNRLYAFHVGSPGISHGCSRLEESVAKALYELVSLYTKVLIKR